MATEAGDVPRLVRVEALQGLIQRDENLIKRAVERGRHASPGLGGIGHVAGQHGGLHLARGPRAQGPGLPDSDRKVEVLAVMRVRFCLGIAAKCAQGDCRILERELDDPRIVRTEPLGPSKRAYSVRVDAPTDLDEQLVGWLAEAYALRT